MGFFDIEEKTAVARDPLLKGLSVKVLHKQQCAVCPLNNNKARSPHMKPEGPKNAKVYILGGAPDSLDDDKDKHFTGDIGRLVRNRIPHKWSDQVRYNYVVRTRPPNDRAPSHVEIECCRPSIVEDIERTKPHAILGFGSLALEWATQQTRSDQWAGHRIPIQVGKHTCWFYAMLDPGKVFEVRRYTPRGDGYGSDLEFQFALNIRDAFAAVDDGLPEPIIHTREDARANITWVTGREKGDLQKVLDYIISCYDEKVVGLDYETDRLRPYDKGAKILSAALARKKDAMAWAMHHRDARWTKTAIETIEIAWRRFLIKARCRKVSHHLAFEMEWSGVKFGVKTLLSRWEDSMSQAYILDEKQGLHSLEAICLKYFGLPIKDMIRVDRKRMADEKVEIVCEYNAIDAKYHRAAFFEQQVELKKVPGLPAVYKEHIRRVRAATMSTMKGVPIDAGVVDGFFEEYDAKLVRIEKKISEMDIARQFARRFKHELRPSNNNDVVAALTKIAGIHLEKVENKARRGKKETGNLSTKEQQLVKLKHPLASAVVRWRKANKLISTYNLPVMTSERLKEIKEYASTRGREIKGVTQLHPGGLLHPIYVTTKVRTWRTSSEDPNIQNWPHRGPGVVIRRQVTVKDDEVIVAIDYAGIQARNVAMESLDKKLVELYWQRYDIHSHWLDELLSIVGPKWRPVEPIGNDLDKDALRKALRNSVKNKFVFPSFFGAIAKTIAGYLGIEERDGVELSGRFFDYFQRVNQWHEEQREFYKEHGYITGLSGFRRRAPIELNQLINAPIQADEAIIVCGAWSRCCETGDPRLVPNWMIHDDLSWVWKKKDLDKMLELVVPLMLYQERAWEKTVPMEIDVSIGQNWCDLKKRGTYHTTKKGGWKEAEGTTFSDRWDYKVGQDAIALSRQIGWDQ